MYMQKEIILMGLNFQYMGQYILRKRACSYPFPTPQRLMSDTSLRTDTSLREPTVRISARPSRDEQFHCAKSDELLLFLYS